MEVIYRIPLRPGGHVCVRVEGPGLSGQRLRTPPGPPSVALCTHVFKSYRVLAKLFVADEPPGLRLDTRITSCGRTAVPSSPR